MYTLRVKEHFDAAHFLPWHEGKCKNLHGHRWDVEVAIESEILNKNGTVIDFDAVKSIFEAVLPDHKLLNDELENPTAELVAEDLFELIDRALDVFGYKGALKEITVWESPDCSVTYKPPMYDLDSLPASNLFECCNLFAKVPIHENP